MWEIITTAKGWGERQPDPLLLFKNRTQCKQVSLFGTINPLCVSGEPLGVQSCWSSWDSTETATGIGANVHQIHPKQRKFQEFDRTRPPVRSWLGGKIGMGAASEESASLATRTVRILKHRTPLASVGLTDAACLRGLNLELRLLTRLRSRSQLRTPILNGIPGQHILVSQSRNAT